MLAFIAKLTQFDLMVDFVQQEYKRFNLYSTKKNINFIKVLFMVFISA